MSVEKTTGINLLVKPKGNILNDWDSGVDYLDHSIYAEALAEEIDRVNTPITIGLFARWGSGKSFLLKHVKNLLDRRQRQHFAANANQRKSSAFGWRSCCCLRTSLFVLVTAAILVTSLWAAHPFLFLARDNQFSTFLPYNSSMLPGGEAPTDHPDKPVSHFSRYIALSFLLFTLVFLGMVMCISSEWWSSKLQNNLRLLLLVAFTKLPIKSQQKSIVNEICDYDVHMMLDTTNVSDTRSNIKYIFVDFNAWEYAGSDTLWAGIITTLSNAVEGEFGSVTSRMFRMLKVKVIPPEIKMNGEKSKTGVIYVRLGTEKENVDPKTFKEAMMQFGVIIAFRKKENSERSAWWEIEYSNLKEAQKAHESLSTLGVEVNLPSPLSVPVIHDENANEAQKLLPKKNNPSGSGSFSRSTEPDKQGKKSESCFIHFIKHPKTICNIPTLFWYIMSFLAFISLPIITYTLADMLQLDVYRTGRTVPVVVQLISWLPAVGATSFVIIKCIWGMLHSQRSRVASALAGTKGNMAAQLGFMNKVKTEVKYITELLHCAEFSNGIQYKIIISIDDLDRCALDKIKSVLEAVSILLSDPSSPFVCLVAVDSRVAVKCIEETMSASLLKSNVNGHEYLKKIINLPFCLPEIDNRTKKRFIDGLVELSDETRKESVRKSQAGIATATPTQNGRLNSIGANPTDDGRKYKDPKSAGDLINKLPNDIELHDLSGEISLNRKESSVVSDRVKRKTSFLKIHENQPKFRDVPDGVPDGVPGGVPDGVAGGVSAVDLDKKDSSLEYIDKERQAVEFIQCEEAGGLIRKKSCINLETEPEIKLDTDKFLFECRKFFYTNEMVQRHLEGNPRNIKRIFNVLSLTSSILHCYEKKIRIHKFFSSRFRSCRSSEQDEDDLSEHKSRRNLPLVRSKRLAQDLVIWVVLIDQWPFRMSYLLEILENHEDGVWMDEGSINDEAISLLDIYRNFVQPEMEKLLSKNDNSGLFALDIHPDMFLSLLQAIKENGFLKNKISDLHRITINLDQSLRQTIVLERERLHVS